ncbi:uncharacterized protein DFL_007876 [Arthrobotrys flagrans]|uniref:RING-type domain-containing protein n=1 Tax=Arthrobotrys flagrans TaxID=97331 RepID=A0A436ZX69_ARTFL|nr:hypothetical protein DFL_007876 [Arthrobotrys flagrans]
MSSSQDPAAGSQPSTEFVHPSGGSQASQTTNNINTTNPRRTPAPAHPINPLKRQLSENMEVLIAQAKASKTSAGSTAAQAAQAETIYDKLERELTCSICCELFKDPITLLNCLHNFCGSCIVPWGRQKTSCPSCRAKIQGCRDAFALKPLIDMLVKEKPELGFSKEDMDGFQSVYKPGQEVSFGDGYSDSGDDDNEVDEDEEEDDEVRYPQLWEPCPCCPQGENANPLYTCSNPIFDGDRTYDWQIEYKGHKKCASCRSEVPFNTQRDALKPAYCACCGVTYCGGIRGTCPNDPNSEFLHNMRVTSLYAGGPNYGALFNNNAFEQDLLRRWVESDANNHTWQSLGNEIREWLFQKYPLGIPGAYTVPVRPDSYVCKNCLPGMFDRYLTDFLISERERLGWTDARSRCWYGKNCRTQRHNPDHCARLSHVWDEVPAEERRETRPARPTRPPQVTHTGGVRDNAPSSQIANVQPADSQPANTQAADTLTQTSTAAAPPPLLRFPSDAFPPSSPGAPAMDDLFGVPYPTNNVFSGGNDDPADAGPSN